MKKNIFVTLFIVVCFALFVVSITLYNCHRANVMLRKTVINQANEISELNISVGKKGEYISVYTNVSADDALYLNLSCVDSREEIDSELADLTDFIKEHIA